MQNLFQLGVRDTDPLAPNSGHACDGRVFERVAKGVSTDHPSRTHDYKAPLVRSRNVRYGRHVVCLLTSGLLVQAFRCRSSIHSRMVFGSKNASIL